MFVGVCIMVSQRNVFTSAELRMYFFWGGSTCTMFGYDSKEWKEVGFVLI